MAACPKSRSSTFGAFVVTFLMLAGLWYSQFTFFRRYGLEDRVTVILNLVLLFMVVIGALVGSYSGFMNMWRWSKEMEIADRDR